MQISHNHELVQIEDDLPVGREIDRAGWIALGVGLGLASLTELGAAHRAELFELTACCEHILQQALHPSGFNIGMNLGAA